MEKINWTEIAKKIVYGISFVFLAFLSVVSILYASDGYELSLSGYRILYEIPLGILLVFILKIVADFLGKPERKYLRWAVEAGLFLGVMVFCGWWIQNSQNLPQSDAKSVYDIACRARDHDLLPIAPTGSYMSLWPHQVGFVLLLEIVLRIFPMADEFTIQWLTVAFVALSLISGRELVRELFRNEKIRIFWCLLMSLFLPYYLHVNNMYSDVPGIALMLFSLWMLTLAVKHVKKIPCIIFSILMCGSTAVMVAVRKNTLIYVIACVLILGVMFLQKHRGKYIALILLLILATIAGSTLPRAFYEHRAHNTMGKGVPAVSFVAMGLQWDAGRAPGGWNGYHADLYMKNNYDAEITSRMSAENIKESLNYMLNHPSYAIYFFFMKQMSQWCREDYGCLYETLDFYADRTQAAWDIYTGKTGEYLMVLIRIYQSIIYIGTLLYVILQYRKTPEKSLCKLIPLTTFIGGFLFSLLWEGGSRYMMPYVILLVPYAAAALSEITLRKKGLERN